MDFNLKTYKRFKIKHYFKTKDFFYFFHGTSLKNENWIKTEQEFARHKLKYIRILNKLMISTLKNSIFKNLVVLIHGPILLLNNSGNFSKLTFEELESVNPLINFLGCKLNNKIYSKKQIKDLRRVSYIENVSIFHNSMKTLTRIPYNRFESNKTIRISK